MVPGRTGRLPGFGEVEDLLGPRHVFDLAAPRGRQVLVVRVRGGRGADGQVLHRQVAVALAAPVVPGAGAGAVPAPAPPARAEAPLRPVAVAVAPVGDLAAPRPRPV